MSDTAQDNKIQQEQPKPAEAQAQLPPITPPNSSKAKGSRLLPLFAILLALAAFGAVAWQYNHAKKEIRQLKKMLSEQQAASAITIQQLNSQIDKIQNGSQALNSRLEKTQVQVNQSSEQYNALNGMYNELSKNRVDWLLSEVSNTLEVTNSNLQLTGDVNAAISSLQNTSDRLAKFDRPQLIKIKLAIAHDLEALKALPKLDTVALSAKLDQLQIDVDTLPLIINERNPIAPANAATKPAEKNGLSFWQRLSGDFMDSLSKIVSIRRIDQPEALLLSPKQDFFLRENIKLHVLNARLALLQRDSKTYNSDLNAVDSYAKRYFDSSSEKTKLWLANIAELKNAPLKMSIPALNASLKAAQDAQNSMEQTP